jgi:hypothetical protein
MILAKYNRKSTEGKTDKNTLMQNLDHQSLSHFTTRYLFFGPAKVNPPFINVN